MLGWLDRLVDEGHRSERIAAWWHLGLGMAGLIAAGWHFFSARRHRRAARRR